MLLLNKLISWYTKKFPIYNIIENNGMYEPRRRIYLFFYTPWFKNKYTGELVSYKSNRFSDCAAFIVAYTKN